MKNENIKKDLPELRFIEQIGPKYLFTYFIFGQDHYTYITPEENKYRLEITSGENVMNMVIEKESRMGKDITEQINKDYENN
jgi:hypothetical protein